MEERIEELRRIIRESNEELLSLQCDGEARDLLQNLKEGEELFFSEPCDCGSRIMHNNGGNYHQRQRITAVENGMFQFETWSTCDIEDDYTEEIVDAHRAHRIVAVCLEDEHKRAAGD